MNGLVITSTSKADLKLFVDLANRIGVPFKSLTDEELQDKGLIKERSTKKSKLLSEIEAGLKDVKMMQEGKVKKKTLKQMLNGN